MIYYKTDMKKKPKVCRECAMWYACNDDEDDKIPPILKECPLPEVKP